MFRYDISYILSPSFMSLPCPDLLISFPKDILFPIIPIQWLSYPNSFLMLITENLIKGTWKGKYLLEDLLDVVIYTLFYFLLMVLMLGIKPRVLHTQRTYSTRAYPLAYISYVCSPGKSCLSLASDGIIDECHNVWCFPYLQYVNKIAWNKTRYC